MVPFDRLSDVEQQTFEALGRDPDCYGIIRPVGDTPLTAKAVTPDTALLLLTLQSPSALPRYALAALGERAEPFISQLILDGILQVDDGGTILSGTEAFELISGAPPVSEPESRLAVLSRNALEYVANLESAPSNVLSGRLYMYNRVPVSERWRRVLPESGAVESYLGAADRATLRTLNAGWRRLPAQDAGDVWMAWQSLWATRPRNAALTYKLYVSPACQELRAGFSALVRTVAQSAAFHFKVGRDVYGLLRPDKMVAYFWSLRICRRPPRCSSKSSRAVRRRASPSRLKSAAKD